jgi:hypothetical protein
LHFKQAVAAQVEELLAPMWQQITNTLFQALAEAEAALVTAAHLDLDQTVEVVLLLFVGHNV